jgi:hypothetical protein
MNAALAFLNGIGRDRPAASDAADDVWMMNILLTNCSPPQRPRKARKASEYRFARERFNGNEKINLTKPA